MYLIFLISIIFFLIKLLNLKKKEYGYLNGHLNNITKNSAKKYNYKIIEIFDSINKNYYLESKAFDKKEVIGNLKLIPWSFNNNTIYIGKDLYVLQKYQRKGIGNEIVKNGVNIILKNGNFGVFCTNKELSLNDCIFKLCWIKTSINLLKESNTTKSLKIVSFSDVSLKHYPFNNNFLNVSKKQIYNFLEYLESIDIIFLQNENNLFAVEKYTDSNNDDVAYIKFMWGDNLKLMNNYKLNICKLLNLTYIAFPEIIDKKTPSKIWDIAYYYLYAKPKKFKYNTFTNRDILAWYL